MRFLTELQSALRRELEAGELLDLENDFYDNVRSWLATAAREARSGEHELDAAVVERAKETVKKLLLLRLIKEVSYIWVHDRIPERRLPKQEAAILENVLNVLKDLLSQIERDEVKRVSKPAPQREGGGLMAVVTFRRPYPKFMLSDGRIVGPFAERDVAVIPVRDAKTLERADAVEVLASLALGATGD